MGRGVSLMSFFSMDKAFETRYDKAFIMCYDS